MSPFSKYCRQIIAFVILVSSLLSQSWVTDISDKFRDSVVGVFCFNSNEEILGTGSGCIISEDGIIATNQHVIRDAYYIWVYFPGDTIPFPATLLYQDINLDHALIQIPTSNLTALELGTSKNTKIGEEIVAIGTPGGFSHSLFTWFANSVTKGMVSNIREESIGNWIAFTAPISSGSSGGALFNSDGELLGLTTMGLGTGHSLNWATPIDPIKNILKQYTNQSSNINQQSNSPQRRQVSSIKKQANKSSIYKKNNLNVIGAIDYPGKAIYDNKCASCHKGDGSGGNNVGTNLIDQNWIYGSSYNEIIKIVSNGNRSTGKIGYSSILSPDDIRYVSRYVKMLSK